MTRRLTKIDSAPPERAALACLEPVKGPTERIGFLLRRAFQLAQENSARAFVDLEITPRQAAAIWQLHERGPLSQGELGAVIGMEAPNVHGLIQRLLKKDIVERARDPRDPRRKVVSLSARGLEVARSLPDRAREAEGRTLSALSPADRAQLISLLERILKAGKAFPNGAA